MYKDDLFLSKKKLMFLSGLAIFLSTSTVAWAYPIDTNIVITCPCSNELQNSNGNIFGLGTELILSQNNPINFTLSIPQSNIPDSFNNYKNTGIEYNSALGVASCNYTSSVATEQSFALAYNIVNGTGGVVQAQSLKTISIFLPIGFAQSQQKRV
jgi:hypothetical protein